MYLVLAIAASAAAVVLAWNRYSISRPELADTTTARVKQLAAVVLAIAAGIQSVLEALTYSRTSQVRGTRLVDWDEADCR